MCLVRGGVEEELLETVRVDVCLWVLRVEGTDQLDVSGGPVETESHAT